MSGQKGRAAEGNEWPEAVFRWHVPNMTLAGFLARPSPLGSISRRDSTLYPDARAVIYRYADFVRCL